MDILVCPFCKSKRVFVKRYVTCSWIEQEHSRVCCKDCGAKGPAVSTVSRRGHGIYANEPDYKDIINESIALWNKAKRK